MFSKVLSLSWDLAKSQIIASEPDSFSLVSSSCLRFVNLGHWHRLWTCCHPFFSERYSHRRSAITCLCTVHGFCWMGGVGFVYWTGVLYWSPKCIRDGRQSSSLVETNKGELSDVVDCRACNWKSPILGKQIVQHNIPAKIDHQLYIHPPFASFSALWKYPPSMCTGIGFGMFENNRVIKMFAAFPIKSLNWN